MNIELIAALSAITVSIAGALFNYYKLKDDQKTWEQEQKISIEKKLLFKRLKKRHKSYSKVFTLLGYVRDIEYPKEHHIAVSQDKEKLKNVADELIKELYGKSGLFMEYKTRSLILKTYQVSYKFINNEATLEELIDSFYNARRAIRDDLEFDDNNGNISKNDMIEATNHNNKRIEKKMNWSINNIIANSSRPGYPNKNVTERVLNETVQLWKQNNIKSIICLLSNEEIKMYYKSIDGELIDFYRKNGFQVFHLSITDFQNPPLSVDSLNEIKNIYPSMNLPTMIHCGAGEDRTGITSDFLKTNFYKSKLD